MAQKRNLLVSSKCFLRRPTTRVNLSVVRYQTSAVKGQPQDDFPPSTVPFSRRNERNPYRLLGVSDDASYEEITDARNYLQKSYGWDEPSKDAIELAYDSIIRDKLSERRKDGPRIRRRGKFGQAIYVRANSSILKKFQSLFDPTVTLTNFINDGVVYGALAMWAFLSSELTMPLSFAMCYSIYSFQTRRTARNPEGQFWGGNALFGAMVTTFAAMAVATFAGISLDWLLIRFRINLLRRSLMPPFTILSMGFLAIVLL
nr:CHAPERONe-LIKe PROTEIn Of POR1-like (POR1) [Polytomella parva]|eukprot:CAMPEP_0175043384 /NCGR_PEP_ID=MMETSP0052_2-20121109/3153_1 /TAXON_ID=51329 ORGANISM="Polytomella parva, Strain SAG 63-3" /NCGR_SAMPLE_ID=MMETSP0052_2 /ASSEMBLY_ACC=CAM_ASM_000194 /LENGTH=258 /DNA_ID=CAMNT_0016306429 /DNA_START=53 /DNA_END=829 /DNA_ORIENTATION=-